MGPLGGVLRRAGQAFAAFRLVGANRSLRLMAIARGASVTGRWAATVALAVYAYDAGGASYVGVLGVVRILPAAAAGPLGALLLDRVRTDRLLLGAGVGRAAAMAGAAIAVADGAHPVPVFFLVAIESLLSTMIRPLQTAALPFLARTPGELTAANLSLTTLESAGMLVGPALSAVLLAVWSTAAVMLLTALSYVLSTVLVARIPSWQQNAARLSGAATPAALAGLQAIRSDRHLRLIVGLYCAENVVTGSLNVLIVIAALKLLDLGESGVGLLNAAVGIGGLVGGVAAAALLGRRRMASSFGAGLVLCGIPVVAIGLHPSPAPTIALLAVLGVGVTVVDFSAITLLQRVIHEQVLAKVFTVLQSLFVASIGLGAALAPILVSWIGARGALLATGMVLPVLALLLWKRLAPLDASDLVGDEVVDLLRGIPIFQPLELPTVERLARAVVPLDVAAGDTVIAEGAPGDLYYVVRDGELDVSIEGLPLRRLGPGSGFGEIALLRSVPRTATVVAASDAKLYALERDRFLDAVNGSHASREAADLVVDSRLGSLRAGLASV